ncbi:DUF433 domain-containing protein [Dyadobacter sp. CY356]|uniref:DUF433 domain-containing protein n=1 Tax=Dyadobacter sp. CY356 TaxID=2906442 RepID=UPI001F2ECCC5|nr:DUF433 domain-containing protein [Dyadobacter sp. CY356]MCF0058615.1 DUF433 domain-containing protein [Dyadobacter sp. CY356]
MQSWIEHITINPEVRFGKPCIINTRITVLDILGLLSNDLSYEEILDDYPQLTREDILASLAFAANKEVNTKILVTSL